MRSDEATVKACLARASKSFGLPRLEAQMLLAYALDQSRVWLIAHDDYVLTRMQLEAFVSLCQRRQFGEPMAYLVGEREFMGLTFEVDPSVLIPRPETELLVQTALDLLADVPMPRVIDLGTGSGAIAVALAHLRPDATVWATDVSADALEVARRNAACHAVKVHALQGSWYEALGPCSLKFDAIISNPPYIPFGDLHLDQGDLRYEPQSSLTDGADGLSAYRQILAGAREHLVPGGCLCVEHGFDQGCAVAKLLQDGGFVGVKTIQDLAGHPRVTAGFYNG